MQTEDDRRWPVGQLKTPPRSGKLPDYDRFDASFFAVHGQQANVREPARLLDCHTLQHMSRAGHRCWGGSQRLRQP